MAWMRSDSTLIPFFYYVFGGSFYAFPCKLTLFIICCCRTHAVFCHHFLCLFSFPSCDFCFSFSHNNEARWRKIHWISNCENNVLFAKALILKLDSSISINCHQLPSTAVNTNSNSNRRLCKTRKSSGYRRQKQTLSSRLWTIEDQVSLSMCVTTIPESVCFHEWAVVSLTIMTLLFGCCQSRKSSLPIIIDYREKEQQNQLLLLCSQNQISPHYWFFASNSLFQRAIQHPLSSRRPWRRQTYHFLSGLLVQPSLRLWSNAR